MSDNVSAGYYVDADGVTHITFEAPQSVLFRLVMQHHMDACHAAGLDGTQAANLLINGAGYLIGAVHSENPELREMYKEQLVTVFRRKVDQAVAEGRKDRERGLDITK
jgi:hypothetical protein